MNPTPIDAVATVVRERFNPEFVQRFPTATDSRIQGVADRIISRIRRTPGEPHPIDVYEAAWHAAKAQGLDVFAHEEDGTQYFSDPAWNAAWKAAFAAAVAYECPDQITDEERRLLVETWESVAGIPPDDG